MKVSRQRPQPAGADDEFDLKAAYEQSMKLAKAHADFSVDMLKGLSALVMKTQVENITQQAVVLTHRRESCVCLVLQLV